MYVTRVNNQEHKAATANAFFGVFSRATLPVLHTKRTNALRLFAFSHCRLKINRHSLKAQMSL
jgi:hypothetical protein